MGCGQMARRSNVGGGGMRMAEKKDKKGAGDGQNEGIW